MNSFKSYCGKNDRLSPSETNFISEAKLKEKEEIWASQKTLALCEEKCIARNEIPENNQGVVAEFVKFPPAARAQQISYCELGKKAEIKIKKKGIRHSEGAVCSPEEFSTSVCKLLDMNVQVCGTNLLSAGELSSRRGQAPLSTLSAGDSAVKHKVSKFQNVPATPRIKSRQRSLYRTPPTPRQPMESSKKEKHNPSESC
ncbi:hypothetical protein DUI87_04226 [Hirundo rustica rustica]|uniref:Uncharacterized protein n=1 Tax=Hirundo rustica rustica TaxID=333673 RepID=A0A3M0L5S6_HIRRU|nr:hypothetical protein DUI87_04226 [Hirundo rustica rustica]